MIPSSLIRKIAALLLLGALLSAPWATAAGPRVPPEPRASGSGFGDLFFQAWSAFTTLWGDNGCTIDPDGRCRGAAAVPVQPVDSLDNGCTIDPNGRCGGAAAVPVQPTGSRDEGCTLDPSGGCLGSR